METSKFLPPSPPAATTHHWPQWLEAVHQELILPRRKTIEAHPFILNMQDGKTKPEEANGYFSGLMWHLLDFGKHVSFLKDKRPSRIDQLLEGRSEDVDGDTDILARIVAQFHGPVEQIKTSPWTYRPHEVWIAHDALLRSAIYSSDFEWQVGTAALNVGIESLVPFMVEPLFKACVSRYGVTAHTARWLESRSGEDEKQHGENGYLILSQYVADDDLVLQQKCRFFIDALSHSMAFHLLRSGMPGKK